MRIVWSFVKQRAVPLEEVQQVRHLLEVGRDIRAVAPEVRVVELQVDHVLDLAVLVAELARRCRAALPCAPRETTPVISAATAHAASEAATPLDARLAFSLFPLDD